MTVLFAPQPARTSLAANGMRVHAVGSVPAAVSGDPARGMRWLLEHRNSANLTALPHDADPRWIIDWLDGLAGVDALAVVRAGPSRDYTDMPVYRIRRGRSIDKADVALGRVRDAAAAFAALDRLAVEFTVPDRVQIGVPHTLDRALFAAGSPQAAADWLPALHANLVDELSELVDRWGDRVQLQLETPAVLMSYHRTPLDGWPELTTRLVALTADVLAITGSAAPWVVHLCYGDLGHRPAFVPAGLDAAVLFLNAVAVELDRRGLPAPTAHLPLCHGAAGPPEDPAYYRPLTGLRRSVDVIAGLVAETEPSASRLALALVTEALAVSPTAIGAPCGLGRRTPAAAAANMRLAADLITRTSPR